MKLQTVFAGAIASAFLSVLVVTASATTVLTDGTFAGGNMSATLISSSSGVSTSWTVCASCGNPGNAIFSEFFGSSGSKQK